MLDYLSRCLRRGGDDKSSADKSKCIFGCEKRSSPTAFESPRESAVPCLLIRTIQTEAL
jgi:hypothetical protein